MRNRLKEEKDLTKHEIYDIIIEYIDSCIATSLREMRDVESFAKPAWSEFQAFQLGSQKALFKLRDFIPSSDQGDRK